MGKERNVSVYEFGLVEGNLRCPALAANDPSTTKPRAAAPEVLLCRLRRPDGEKG